MYVLIIIKTNNLTIKWNKILWARTKMCALTIAQYCNKMLKSLWVENGILIICFSVFFVWSVNHTTAYVRHKSKTITIERQVKAFADSIYTELWLETWGKGTISVVCTCRESLDPSIKHKMNIIIRLLRANVGIPNRCRSCHKFEFIRDCS